MKTKKGTGPAKKIADRAPCGRASVTALKRRAAAADPEGKPTPKESPKSVWDDDVELKKLADRSEHAIGPASNAAAVIQPFAAIFGEQDFSVLNADLTIATQRIWDNDMRLCEAMLYCQAAALQSIFTTFARQATQPATLQKFEAYMRVALKAQNQARMTLETLGMLKNPTTVIARQANITQGPQQVNNGVRLAADLLARAPEVQSAPTELLEVSDGERLDTRATSAPVGADSRLETLGTIDGPAHDGWEGARFAQQRPRREAPDRAGNDEATQCPDAPAARPARGARRAGRRT